MNVKDKIIQSQKKIIDALSGCESNIGLLYKKYAKMFPEMQKQWHELSDAEELHASLLQTMHRILDKGSIFYNLGKFSDEAIQPMITLIDNAVKKADTHDLTCNEAIATALKIESSVMDSHFYDIVNSDAPEFKIIAERLTADTKKHVEMVRNYLEKRIKS